MTHDHMLAQVRLIHSPLNFSKDNAEVYKIIWSCRFVMPLLVLSIPTWYLLLSSYVWKVWSMQYCSLLNFLDTSCIYTMLIIITINWLYSLPPESDSAGSCMLLHHQQQIRPRRNCVRRICLSAHKHMHRFPKMVTWVWQFITSGFTF